ncbi:hypothetical protein DPMN_056490 [Dreissena polymorpha]|uniref:Uncharacterized protein n=1 Tax=Dreissena polymorpha TaxID=45954 RepID=A0A9D4CRT9_DREPO|nr:hypothetical protein DPMN_056490 [Dreissena polymorpha]
MCFYDTVRYQNDVFLGYGTKFVARVPIDSFGDKSVPRVCVSSLPNFISDGQSYNCLSVLQYCS